MTTNLKKLIFGALAFLALIGTAVAEEEEATLNSGDTAWMIVAAVLDELDLTAIVRDRLPAEAVETVIARIDLVALADEVINGVDLPAIIRGSTNSVTAEVMTDVRTQGERADDAVSGFVDRVLGRRQGSHDRP